MSDNEKNAANQLKTVNLYTDGACSGNPGPGGWGAVLCAGEHTKELCGGEPDTTNNRMELTAVIMGLKALKRPCKVIITTDSKYVCDAITLGWAKKWKANGWMRNNKDKAMNPDLWEELLALLAQHDASFKWVKGHAGHPMNERCDQLAVGYYVEHFK